MAIEQEIKKRIDAFVTELETLIRTAAVESVAQALGSTRPTRTAPPAARATAPRPRGRTGGKRDPKLIAALVDRVGTYIKQNPGQGVEAIARGMKLSTRELGLPITKLLAAKTIKKKGQKRATKYYPA